MNSEAKHWTAFSLIFASLWIAAFICIAQEASYNVPDNIDEFPDQFMGLGSMSGIVTLMILVPFTIFFLIAALVRSFDLFIKWLDRKLRASDVSN